MSWWKRTRSGKPSEDVSVSTVATTGETGATSQEDSETPKRSRSLTKAIRSQLSKPGRAIAVSLILLLGGLVVTAPRWLPDLDLRPEYQVKSDLIKITPPPDYIPADFLKKVLKESGLPGTLPLLDPQLVPKVVEAFQRNAWVEKVVHVRKSYPSELVVELRYRAPVAMVRDPEGRYPVDGSGIVLPPEDFTPEMAARYPDILNVPIEEKIQPGQVWNNAVVCEAARLLDQLRPQIEQYHIVGVVVPQADSTDTVGPFILKTRGKTEIVWGKGPSQDRPGQVSTRLRIERLEDYARKWKGDLDSEGVTRIDFTYSDSIRLERSALAEQPAENRQRN